MIKLLSALFLIGLAAAIFATNYNAISITGLALAMMGGALFAGTQPPAEAADPPAENGPTLKGVPRWQFLAGLLVGIAGGAVIGLLAMAPRGPLEVVLVVAGWLLSIGAFLALAISGPEWGALREKIRRDLRENRRFWTGILILTLIGAGLRAWRVVDFAPALSGDEVMHGLDAQEALYGEFAPNPFGVGWRHGHRNLYYVPMMLTVTVFGNTAAALRPISVLFGALSIPAVAVLGRALFGKREAWIAAAFLMSMGLHLHMSRIATNHLPDALFSMLAFAAMAYALRGGGRAAWALSGALLGIAQYFYAAALLLPLLALCWIAFIAWQERRVEWGGLLIFGCAFFIALMPLIADATTGKFGLNPRMGTVNVFTTGLFEEARTAENVFWKWFDNQLYRSAMAFVQIPDAGGRWGVSYYQGKAPIVGHTGVVPFIFGLALAAKRWRHRKYALLLGWLAATVLGGGAIIATTPTYVRYIVGIPAAVMVIAVGVAALLPPARSGPRRSRAVLLLIMSAVFAAANIYHYFGIQLKEWDQFGENTIELNQFGQIMAEEPPESVVIALTGFEKTALHKITAFLAPGETPHVILDPNLTYSDEHKAWMMKDRDNEVILVQPDKKYVFVFGEETLERATFYFKALPGGGIREHNMAGNKLFAYRTSGNSVPSGGASD